MAELQKNVVLRWLIKLVQSSDHLTPATGATITATVSRDGGAFASLNGSPTITEISSGWYWVDVAAADMNADVVVLRATAAAADDFEEKIYTQATIISDLTTAAHFSSQADRILRRAYGSARVSADGDTLTAHSLMGAIAWLANTKIITGSTLDVKHEDGTTSFKTYTLTASASANPITGVTA